MSQASITIDGSLGEGGGQILRTSVSLSAITGKPVRVINIRAKRDNAGLRPQHLTAIQAMASLFGARTENLKVGADSITFEPSGGFVGQESKFDVGTAGSIPMILLTVIPAVALTGNRLELELVGGTDVRASPTIDYIRYVVQDVFRSMGIMFSIDVIRRGYYPKGGGVVRARIEPCLHPDPMDLTTIRSSEPRIASVCSLLPKHVAERQITSAIIAMEKQGIRCRTYSASLETAMSPGSSILVYTSSDFGPFIGGDSIGELGKPAETVGQEAARRFIESASKGVPVDPFLADMIVLPLAIARGRSRYRIARATSHLRTNLLVASKLTGCRYNISDRSDGTFIVDIEG
ncbi:MAG TPA: RNA 3'-terminal phosphate cyclase [Nitrososphaera sp.]|nr:RNA 3'-terminal phosphate cyclase [Nitrososphaera sp.]